MVRVKAMERTLTWIWKYLFSLPLGGYSERKENFFLLRVAPFLERFQIHCSAFITRLSGAMNTDRDIRGPRYTEHDIPAHVHHCSFLKLL